MNIQFESGVISRLLVISSYDMSYEGTSFENSKMCDVKTFPFSTLLLQDVIIAVNEGEKKIKVLKNRNGAGKLGLVFDAETSSKYSIF